MLSNSGIRDICVTVIYYCISLIISIIIKLLKPQCSIRKSSIFIIKPSIKRSRIKNIIEIKKFLAANFFPQNQIDIFIIQHGCNNIGITIFRHSLVSMIEIIIIIIKAQRKAFKNASRQLLRITPPLLYCISFKEGFVQILPYKAQSLLFKSLRRSYAFIRNALDIFFRLIRRKCFAKKLIYGMQINRQRINRISSYRFNPVDIRNKFTKLINIIPNAFIVGVENMWTIRMNHHARGLISLCITISTNVFPTFKHRYLMTNSTQSISHNCTRKTGTNNRNFHSTPRFHTNNANPFFFRIFSIMPDTKNSTITTAQAEPSA